MSRHWRRVANGFEIEWGELTWTLQPDAAQPGLVTTDTPAPLGPLLALEGLAAAGRSDPDALGGQALVEVTERLGRIEATYAPAGWGEIRVRAAWFASGDAVISLEVEVSARSVGDLCGVEVRTLSVLTSLPPAGSLRSVEPRDRQAAALSYDGRETDLAGLTSAPPEPIRTPWLAPKAGRDGWTYVEFVHPDDASRRIHEGRSPHTATRYGLFGYDLERGVVLRGRLRGLWLPKDRAFTESAEAYRAFLDEPPPLTT